MTGKCPQCQKVLTHVFVEQITVRVRLKEDPQWKGASYVCPNCHSVLSIGIDPVALKEDTVTEILDRLRKQ